ncbi:hypothetical protein [Thermomonospora umbrina]|uniref:Uncharacterized protein n=1 Tax=Thermomonospora umbrina TaxID=111806 RepID=A0A3D9T4V5_9ACTN|nr:hypothetical protein [Thermomonospora umbrina]REF00276.1 hypothetical protein DFJ69_5805 [Thermomonospora umbrina]
MAAPTDFAIGWEWNTGRILYYDPGTGQWATLGPPEDTGNVPLPLAAGFSSAGQNTVRKIDGVVYIDLNARAAAGLAVVGGTRVAAIPSAFQPAAPKPFALVLPGAYCRLVVQPTGHVEMTLLSESPLFETLVQGVFSYVP